MCTGCAEAGWEQVGGASEVEVGERKDRFVDALNATRAAVEEGIVPGGGVALLRASAVLEKLLKGDRNEDMKVGVKIVKKACQEPCFLIAQNAGYEGAVIVEQAHFLKSTLMSDLFSTYTRALTLILFLQVLKAGTTMGFNAYEGKMVDMMQAGIIDPVKVVRVGLQVREEGRCVCLG